MNTILLMVIAVLLTGVCALLAMLWFKEPVKLEIPKTAYVPAISNFDANKDVTTVCPVPMGAHTCTHDWETVDKEVLEVAHQQKLVIVLQCPKCGLIDKTVQTTDKAPPPPPAPPAPRSECLHRWEKEKQVILDSAYEQMAKVRGTNGQWKKDVKIPDLDMKKLEPWVFKKKYISVRTCTKCGEVEKTITANFEGEEGEDESGDD